MSTLGEKLCLDSILPAEAPEVPKPLFHFGNGIGWQELGGPMRLKREGGKKKSVGVHTTIPCRGRKPASSNTSYDGLKVYSSVDRARS
jgi:hypothetical protein